MRHTARQPFGPAPLHQRALGLHGQTAMVAGATGAIGRAVCGELLSDGARVIGLGRDEVRLERLAGELSRFEDRFATIRVAGLSEFCWDAALTAATAITGPIGVFVHAIGTLTPGAVLELDESRIAEIVETNFLSVIASARAVARHMLARGHGQLVVVGSLGGLIPMPYQAIYSASKFGVRGFCLALHEELRPRGVVVALIEPGPVHSPMLEAERVDRRAALVFATRAIEPGRVARRVVRLIRRPGREALLPGGPLRRLATGILGGCPGLFGLLFPLLRATGRHRLASGAAV